MGLHPQTLISRVIIEAYLEEPLRRFFLSGRPGMIYGAGNLVKRLLAYCHIFHKQIACLLLLPDEVCTAVMRHGNVPCHEACALPENFEPDGHDLLVGLHETRHAELEATLAADGIRFATVCSPSSWKNALEALEGAKARLFALYEEYEKNAARTSAAAQPACVARPRKKLLIHAGMPKTGTTALQKFLFINRDRLKPLGFYYKTPLRDEEKHKEMLTGYENIYFEDLCDSNYDNLLSAEYFIFKNIDDFKMFTQHFKTKFIIYLREPFGFAQSYMLHTVRTFPVNTSRPPLPINRIYEYMAIQLDLLYTFFHGKLPGNDRLILRSFCPNQAPHWIERDFCRCIPIEPLTDFMFPGPQNVNLPVEFCFFMAHLSSLPLTEEEFFNIEDELQLLAARKALSAVSFAPAKFRLFSRRQIERVPGELIRRYTEVGHRMGDDSFYERGREAFLQLDQVPFRQLPEDMQYEIFYELSPRSQKAILRLWPLWRELPQKLRGSGFLPDIPEDAESFGLLRCWAKAHYTGLSMC